MSLLIDWRSPLFTRSNSSKAAWVQRILGATLVGWLLTCGVANAQIGVTSLPDFASLVKANSPAVVNISTDQVIKKPQVKAPGGDNNSDAPEFDDFLKEFLDGQPSRESKSLGSGFVITSDGVIMTSAHVIEDAKRIIVRLADRREKEAEVIGLDRKSDVAVLKIDAQDLTTVSIGNPADLEVGEWVLAIGSPFGFESSATAGIVSAKGRSLPNENYVPFIQTDVAINPGNSGGPLFNLNGEVIGVNAQIYSRTGGFMGLSFAVPIDLAMRIGDQLRDSGRVSRGWLGVAIQEVSPEMAASLGMLVPRGALITEVLGDGPAADSELQAGDVVVAFNDIPIENMAQLPPVVGQTAVKSSVMVDIVRDSEPMQINVKVGELPTDEQIAEAASAPLSVPEPSAPNLDTDPEKKDADKLEKEPAEDAQGSEKSKAPVDSDNEGQYNLDGGPAAVPN